jgi:hypothetical protein
MIAQHIADTLIDETVQPSLEDNALLNERKLFTASIKLAIKDAEHLYSLGKRNPLVLRHKDFQGETQDLVDYFEQQSMQPGGLGFVCFHLEMDANRFSEFALQKFLNPLQALIERTQRSCH